MARNITLKVSFGQNKALFAAEKVKKNLTAARLALLNEVKPAFNEWQRQNAEVKIGEEEEGALYLYGSVNFEGEEALSKEIKEMCDALYKKIQEYDALMKFEISKAPGQKGE